MSSGPSGRNARVTPSIEQVLSLPATIDREVPESAIDENGHMNITEYFAVGAWGLWLAMKEGPMGEDYIAERGLSFFTVEHHLRYLAELRLGERYAVHASLVGRAGKAVQGVAYVVDRTHDRVACQMDIMYVHVDINARRAVPIPDDVAAILDAQVAQHPWLADIDSGVSLRR